jgi:hypothetical protein
MDLPGGAQNRAQISAQLQPSWWLISHFSFRQKRALLMQYATWQACMRPPC